MNVFQTYWFLHCIDIKLTQQECWQSSWEAIKGQQIKVQQLSNVAADENPKYPNNLMLCKCNRSISGVCVVFCFIDGWVPSQHTVEPIPVYSLTDRYTTNQSLLNWFSPTPTLLTWNTFTKRGEKSPQKIGYSDWISEVPPTDFRPSQVLNV